MACLYRRFACPVGFNYKTNSFLFLDSRRKQSVLNATGKNKRLAAREETSLKRQTATTPKQRQKQTVLQLARLKKNVLQKPTKLPQLLQQPKQQK